MGKLKKVLLLIIALCVMISIMSIAATAATSLPTAVDGVITLTEDVTLSSTWTLYSDTTLDLNGQTLTMNVTSGMTGAVYLNGHSLTIQDNSTGKTGRMDITSSAGSNSGYGFYLSGSGSNLLIEGGDITVTNAASDNWWNAKGVYAVGVSSGTSLTMSGGSLTASNANNSGKAAYAVYVTGGTVSVTGGTIIVDDHDTYGWSEGHLVYKSSGTVSITGGKFKSPKQLDYDDLESELSGNYMLSAADSDGYRTVASAVAKINTTKYASLADAVAAVPTDGTATTITMIADSTESGFIEIAATKNIVLDLNGYTVSSTASGNSWRLIANKGTLTIKDSSNPSTGKITANGTVSGGELATIYNLGGTLNVQSGKIEYTGNYYISYAVSNSSNAWGVNDDKETVFNMTGGVLSAPSGDASLRVYQNCSQAADPYSHNTVTISGGTLDKGIFVDTYIYNPNANTTGAGISTNITITGGTINGLIDLKLRHPYNTTLNIEGGDFTNAKLWVRKHSEWNAVTPEPTSPIVTISGGTWSFVTGKAFGLAYDCGATSWTSYAQPYYVTGGVFNVDLNDFSGIVFPEGKTGVANTDSATAEAYPYTVGFAPVATYTVTFQMTDSVGKIVIQGLDDNVHQNVFDTWNDGVNNRPNIRIAFTQTVEPGGTATKPTNTPYYDYNITQPNNGNPKTFTNADSHVYTFDGWATADGELYDFTTPVTENLTLHPRFSATGATILINNETELRAFAREVELGRKFREQWGEEKQTVKLANDITLTGSWTPVAGFEGIFDGDNHSISGLVISATGDYAGFFSGLNSHTVVKDLTFVSPTVTSSDEYVGVLAGSASSNASTIHPQVSNVNVTGAFSVSGENNVGALIGQVNNGVTITGCDIEGVNGTVTATGSDGRCVGGLLGNTIGTVSVTDCSVSGVTVTGYRKIGGLIGQVQGNLTCTGASVSNVTLHTNASTDYSKALTMGGFVGIFPDSYSGSTVSGTVSDLTMTGPANIAEGKVYIMGLVSGGTGGTAEAAESAMTAANMTFDVTVSGTNNTTIYTESTYEGINGNPSITYVAQIGTTKYTSLADAIAAAQAGDTIELIADDNVSLTSGGEIEINKTLTITGAVDANGNPLYTIYGDADSSGQYNDIFIGTAGIDVTISNVNIANFGNEVNTKTGKVILWIGTHFTGTLTLDNVHMSGLNSRGILFAGGTFAVNNCVIDCTSTVTGAYTKGIEIQYAATGTIMNTTIIGVTESENVTTGGIEYWGTQPVTVENCTISGKSYGVATGYVISNGSAANGTITLKNNTINSDNAAINSAVGAKNEPNVATIIVESGTYYSENYAVDYNGGTIIINGGSFSGLFCIPDGYESGITIYGGTFDDDPTDYVAEGYAASYDDDLWTVVPAVASITIDDETTYYASLADAIAAAEDGVQTTITMIDNSVETGTITIASTKNIVLDLNGYTVSYSENASNKSVYFITNKGTLTIKDTSENGNGNIEFTANPYNTNYSKETVTIYNLDGTLNLQSGKITNASGGGLAYAVNNSSNAWGKGDDKETVFNMTGGVLSAPHGDAALRVYQNCAQNSTPYSHNTVNITGGTILDTGIFVDNNIYQATAQTTGEGILIDINISGGTINGLIDMKLRHTFNTSLTVTGGDFTNAKLRVRKQTDSSHVWGVQGEPTEPIVTISGGTWSFVSSANSAFNVSSGWTTTSSWTSFKPYSVTGGVFNVDLNDYSGIVFPENKIGVANTDSATAAAYPYTVGNAVAQIGNKGYASLADAIAAAQSGDTIVLLADIDLTETVNITKNLTINGDDHTITFTNGGNSNYYGFQVIDEGLNESIAVTISNVTINTTGYQVAVIANCDYNSTAVLNNVTINTDGAAVYSNGHALMTLNGCTITRTGKYANGKDAVYYSALNVGYGGGIVISDSNITVNGGNGVGTFPSGGSVTLTNVDITVGADDVSGLEAGYALWSRNEDYTYYPEYCRDSIITFNSGKVVGEINITDKYTSGDNNIYDALIDITGGYFTADPTAYVAEGYTVEASDIEGYNYKVVQYVEQSTTNASTVTTTTTDEQSGTTTTTTTTTDLATKTEGEETQYVIKIETTTVTTSTSDPESPEENTSTVYKPINVGVASDNKVDENVVVTADNLTASNETIAEADTTVKESVTTSAQSATFVAKLEESGEASADNVLKTTAAANAIAKAAVTVSADETENITEAKIELQTTLKAYTLVDGDSTTAVKATKVVYEITPVAVLYKVENEERTRLGEAIALDNADIEEGETFTFTIPVPANMTASTIKVSHIGTDGYSTEVGTYTPSDPDENGIRYITVTVDHFSEFELEEAEVAIAGSCKISAAIALNDSIDINFYVKNLASGTNKDNYKVVYSFNGEESKTVYGVDWIETESGSGKYFFKIAECAACQVDDKVNFKVYYNDVEIASVDSYSIRDYCVSKINSNSNQKLVELCRAVLDYGTEAQLYFGYKTSLLANRDGYGLVSPIDVIPSEVSAISVNKGSDVSRITAAFNTVSKAEINFYITASSDVTDVVVKLGDTVVENVETEHLSDGRYKVAIKGIASMYLSNVYTLKFTTSGGSSTVQYSALSYTYTKQNSTNARDLSLAIYNYYLNAREYFNSLSN